jgi:hypothetical protein
MLLMQRLLDMLKCGQEILQKGYYLNKKREGII